ncbi:hypothetical protein T10_11102, partial [Trichinella papuae]
LVHHLCNCRWHQQKRCWLGFACFSFCLFSMMKTNGDEIQFVSTQRNQQKLIYRGRCFTLKRTK